MLLLLLLLLLFFCERRLLLPLLLRSLPLLFCRINSPRSMLSLLVLRCESVAKENVRFWKCCVVVAVVVLVVLVCGRLPQKHKSWRKRSSVWLPSSDDRCDKSNRSRGLILMSIPPWLLFTMVIELQFNLYILYTRSVAPNNRSTVNFSGWSEGFSSFRLLCEIFIFLFYLSRSLLNKNDDELPYFPRPLA